MKASSTVEAVAAVATGLLVAVAILIVTACTPAQSEWPPAASFEQAAISGRAVVDTPSGQVTIDLATGIVGGGEAAGVRLVGLEVLGSVAFGVNGTTHAVKIASLGEPDGDTWAQCVEAESLSDVGLPMLLRLRSRPPGLPEKCGPAAFTFYAIPKPSEEVETPQRE